MLTKRDLILIGIGVFIVCFVLLFIIGSLSLPKSQYEKMKEAELILPSGEIVPMPTPATGGDIVRIKDDLVFFWPLTFTENYEGGEYSWIFADCPPDCAPSFHPFVLLYWAFVSAVISLLVVRILSKKELREIILMKHPD